MIMKVQKKLTIKNKLGLHARPAAMFVALTGKFESEITVSKGKVEVDGKSIMGIMMLAAGKGSKILVKVQGRDANKAIAGIERFLDNQALEEQVT